MPKIIYMSINKVIEDFILIKRFNPLSVHIFNKL